ncbi:MAG: hypothetical protein Q8K75_07820 [Chlamydiales bacterium]|nr:hypothetical protein [Chlamydiales bacterium]
MDNINNNFKATVTQNVNTQPIDDAQIVLPRHGKSFHSLLLQQATRGLDHTGRDEFLGQVIISEGLLGPASLLFTETMPCSMRLDITNKLSEIVEEQRIALTEASQNVINDFSDSNRVKFVNALQKISKIIAAPQILNIFAVSDIQEVTSNLECVESIFRRHPKHGDCAVEHTYRLITEVMDKSYFLKVINTLQFKKRADCASLLEHTLSVVTDVVDISQRFAILKTLSEINIDQRKNLIDHAIRLSVGLTSNEKKLVTPIRVLQTIPVTDQASLVDLTLRIVTDKIGSDERAAILQEIGHISPANRMAVVENALLLTTTQTKSREMAYLLRIVDQVPQDNRALIEKEHENIRKAVKYLLEEYYITFTPLLRANFRKDVRQMLPRLFNQR